MRLRAQRGHAPADGTFATSGRPARGEGGPASTAANGRAERPVRGGATWLGWHVERGCGRAMRRHHCRSMTAGHCGVTNHTKGCSCTTELWRPLLLGAPNRPPRMDPSHHPLFERKKREPPPADPPQPRALPALRAPHQIRARQGGIPLSGGGSSGNRGRLPPGQGPRAPRLRQPGGQPRCGTGHDHRGGRLGRRRRQRSGPARRWPCATPRRSSADRSGWTPRARHQPTRFPVRATASTGSSRR